MTKSGIGTSTATLPISNQHHQTTTNSSAQISKTEIPIWVSDRKKWVTGINKRTTINDLIFAVLKQCQVVPSSTNHHHHQPPQQTLKNATKSTTNDSSSTYVNIMEQISTQYVLAEIYFEQQQQHIDPNNTSSANLHTSQRILDNDSKVYKYFGKWLQAPSNYMLKILQRQDSAAELEQQSTAAVNNNAANGGNHPSLASKLLKKFGVSSNLNHSSGSVVTGNSQLNINQSTTTTSKSACRFVDVKLPSVPATTTPNKSVNNHSPATSSTTTATSASNTSSNSNAQHQQQRNFDPSTQKMFLFNAIVDKENKLRQQKERFQLIDELLKETEKTASKNMTPANLLEQLMQAKKTTPAMSLTQLKHAAIDLNDIYVHFPEMSTHNLNDVEEFTLVCTQLFQLEESIKAQKDMLASLETELQRELNNNPIPFGLGGAANQASSTAVAAAAAASSNETTSTETLELRKEVSLSREQTRVQCKQLHDLDARMRLHEQSLAQKEQQLQQLLEELYIQEMYADDAVEAAILNTTSSSSNEQQRKTKPIGLEGLSLNETSEAAVTAQTSEEHDPVIMISDPLDMCNVGEFLDLEHEQQQHIQLRINNEYPAISQRNYNHCNLMSNGGATNGSMRVINTNQTQHTQFMTSLNPSQKSLSYGNLLNENAMHQQQKPHQAKSSANLSPEIMMMMTSNNNGTICSPNNSQLNPNKSANMHSIKISSNMKPSPSLDLSKAVNGGGVKASAANNGGSKTTAASGGYVIMNGTGGGDHSGDNDSGISSVSSEATNGGAMTSTSTMTTTTALNSTTSASTMTTLPINVIGAYTKQQQQMQVHLQHQRHQQQQLFAHQTKMQHLQQSLTNVNSNKVAVSSSSCSVKPVLETLV